MGIKKLVVASATQALKGMEVGETCEVPSAVSNGFLRERCSTLRKEGYEFTTKTCDGVQYVTRLK